MDSPGYTRSVKIPISHFRTVHCILLGCKTFYPAPYMGLYALQFIPLRVQRSSAVLKGFNAPLTEFKQFTIMDVGTVVTVVTVGKVATKVTLVFF